MMDRPNLLVIVCDTLRPDYLSPYGGKFKTQFFDKLADSGVLFENAYAAGPGTPVSHAALFSGQYPSTSGVGGQVDVPDDIPHIAEHFSDAGYETFGMPGPSRIGSHWHYDRGFDEYLEKWVDIPSSLSIDDLKKGLADPTLLKPMPREFLRRFLYGDDEYASYLLDVFEAKTKKLNDPWLSFVNVTIAHGPFNPPRPYKREQIPEWKRPPIGVLDRFIDERIDRPDVRANRVNAVQCAEGFARYLADQDYLNDKELDALRSLYAASVRYLDDQLAALFDGLEEAGDLENTVVVLLADHGEYLGERGLTSHEYLHFDEILHVPLLFTGPEVPTGKRRTDLVSLVDVFPTLCDLTGIDAPAGVDGQSVFDGEPNDVIFAVNGVRETPEVYEDYLSKETLNWLQRGMKSARTDEHFYTIDSAGEERLYTRQDQKEIPEPDPDVLSTYRSLVRDRLTTKFPPGSQQDDYGEEIEANLRHLGYID